MLRKKKKNEKALIPDQLFAQSMKLVKEFMFWHNAFDFKHIKIFFWCSILMKKVYFFSTMSWWDQDHHLQPCEYEKSI